MDESSYLSINGYKYLSLYEAPLPITRAKFCKFLPWGVLLRGGPQPHCPTGKGFYKVKLVLVTQKRFNMIKFDKIISLDIPVFLTLEALRKNIDIDKKYFYRTLFYRNSLYKSIQILKKNGSDYRQINAPILPLKRIQRWILENILYKIPIEDCAHGFVRGKSIITNAYPHVNSKYILKMDIVDFFPSIHFGLIKKFFYDLGYSNTIACALANLCTFNSQLPQGAPTSPYLANIICIEMDKRIQGLCKKNRLKYTRYADDITISGNSNVFWIKDIVEKIVNCYGFQINQNKTVVIKPGDRKKVTGIIVNEKLSVPKSIVRKLRQDIYYIKTFDLESHMERISFTGTKQQYISQLYGVASFIKMVDIDKGLYFISTLDSIFKPFSPSIAEVDLELDDYFDNLFNDLF